MADIQGLIQHLRSQTNPGSADASALAAQYGVDESLVRNAMQTLSRSTARAEPARKKENTGPGFVARLIAFVQSKPGLAIGACGLGAFLMMLLAEVLTRPAVFAALIMVLLFVLASFGVAALSRRARFGAMTGPVLMGALLLELVLTGQGKNQSNAAIGLGLMALMVSIFGVLAAILGGYIWLKRRQKGDRNMTRQQMLDRLIQVRLALEYPRAAPPPTKWRVTIDWLRCHFWWVCGALATVMAVVQTVIFHYTADSALLTTGEIERSAMTREELMAAALLAVAGFGQFLVMILIGYLGHKLWRTVAGTIIYQAVSWVPGLLGWNPLAFSRLQTMPIGQVISSYVALILCALIGGGAAAIEEYTVRARLRQDNDPDALLAELLELEIALGGGLQESYVLVVDVAGSTAMKKDADPLVAEWTFRAYQEVVARVGALHNGTVESTAGDGAVLAFPSANHALASARALLGAMPEFNASTNRLGTDFVLRIGLHCGEVRGGLNEVQFTRVIDVAAHVEASSPRNGVGMTSVFRDKLDPVPELEKLAVSVDGFDVYVTSSACPS